MPANDICIYFIIAILGLAYPIALQVVARLDEKYLSKNILALFRRTNEWIAFEVSLFSSLGYVVIYVVYETGFKKNCDSTPCYDWADGILLTITILLIITFLFYTRKIFTFYVPNELIRYIRTQNETDDHEIFNCMTDVLYTAIRAGDEDLAQSISSYVYQSFKTYRDGMKVKEKPYPEAYYRMSNKTIMHTAGKAPLNVQFVGNNAASGRWLLGAREYFKIHQLTYDWLWNNLRLIVTLKEDDYLLSYWKNAHGFYDFALKSIPLQADPESGNIINRKAVDERDYEQNKFLRFHFALGGMLLYGNRYGAIKRIFHETNSNPSIFLLLPKTMSEIFNAFLLFFDPEERMVPFPYHFTEDHNLYGEGQSKNSICKYIALLMLRQYTIVSVIYGYEPTEDPILPSSQRERRKWIDNLGYFKGFLQEVLQDFELLKTVGFEHLNEAWFAKENKVSPLILIDRTIERVTEAHLAEKEDQGIDPARLRLFKIKSGKMVAARIASYASLQNAEPISDDYETVIIAGVTSLYDKAAFSSDQDISYINYDTYLGGLLNSKITRELTSMFRSKVTSRYLMKDIDLFRAIDRLNLNPNEHVILNFGIDISLVNHKIKEQNLSRDSYRDIKIVTVEYVARDFMRSSLVVMKKSQLPQFVFKEADVNYAERFKLELIREPIYLYAQVIDLNEQKQLRTLFESESEEVLLHSVYLLLALQMEVRWRKNLVMVELRLHSPFFQQGIADGVDDVKVFS